jgi:putative membrane protein
VADPPTTPNQPAGNAQHPSDAPVGVNGSRIREHLASERTYLAWVRTSIAVMAFGLAATKFGSRNVVYAFTAGSVLIGTAIAVFGYATVRYRLVSQEIVRGRFTIGGSVRGPITAAVGLVLAVIAVLFLLIR